MPRRLSPTSDQFRRAIAYWQMKGDIQPLEALLDQVASPVLPQLDVLLREVLMTSSKDVFTVAWMQRQSEVLRNQPTLVYLLACHPSGQVREAAVQLLGGLRTPLATGLLLVRLNDWAAPVRHRARQALSDPLSAPDSRLLLHHFALVSRLTGAVRAPNLELPLRVMALLETEQGRQDVQAVVPTLEPATRLACAQLILRRDSGLDASILALFLDDPHAAVRRLAVAAAPVQALPPFLGDPDARVREMALSRLLQEASGEQNATWLAETLLDAQERVRLVASYALKQRGVDLRQSYLKHDPAQLAGTRLLGWIAGLAVTGTAADAELIAPLVQHPRSRVRAEALHALGTLDPQRYLALLTDSLLGSTQVSRVATRILIANQLFTPALLRRLWSQATTSLQQGRLIALAPSLGRFEAAGVLLQWYPEVAPSLIPRVDRWLEVLLEGAQRLYFTQPPASLLAALHARVQQLPADHSLAQTLRGLNAIQPH